MVNIWIWILHAIYVNDLKVYHNLEPMSYLLGQFHTKAKFMLHGNLDLDVTTAYICSLILKGMLNLDQRLTLYFQGHSPHIAKFHIWPSISMISFKLEDISQIIYP